MKDYLRWLFRKHLKALLSVATLLFLTFILNIGNTIYSYSLFAIKQLQDYSYEFEIVDIEYLCRLVDCEEVLIIDRKSGKMIARYRNVASVLRPINLGKIDLLRITDGLYYNQNSILIQIDDFNKTDKHIFFRLTFTNYLINLFYMYAIVSVFVFFIFLRVMRSAFEKERLELLVQLSGSEALLNNKSISLMTEHAHHEMNTPIEVVENKIEKIHRLINRYLILEDKENGFRPLSADRLALNKKLVGLEKDFEFIKLSIDQIFGVLGKMRKFKQIRLNSGAKNVYDSVTDSFGMVAISNNLFKYSVDERLKVFDLDSKDLRASGLRSILINHLKNSLEACATDIKIIFVSLRGRYLTFNLEDNGNGIKEDIVDKIFEPNYSTKESGSMITRGNGMYLNKHLVTSIGGDINIIKTSITGTVVSIIIPVKRS